MPTVFEAWMLNECDDPRRVEAVLAAALSRAGIIVDDAVLVSWPQARRQPQLRPVENIPRSGALGEAFWGLYFGTLFFAPHLLTADISADEPESAPASPPAALPDPPTGGFATVGLTDEFTQMLRTSLNPGGAALLVLCDEAASSHIRTALTPHGGHCLRSTTSGEQLTRLRATFTR